MKTLKRAALGFVIGMAVGNVIAALTGHPDIVSPELLERTGSLAAALILQTVLSGVIGLAGFAAVSLYEIERWPLLLINLVHYLIYMFVFIVIARILCWFYTAADTLIMAGIMAAAHFIIFLIMCAVYRTQVKKLNKMQMQYKENDTEK